MQTESQFPVFENYLSLARRYCYSCESALKGDQRQFLSHVQGSMLELYSLGRLLPEIHASEQDFNSMFESNDKEVQRIIADKVLFSYYWQALEPFSADEPPLGVGDLLDDLADIYVDFKRVILLYDSKLDGAQQEAFWKLKFDFDHHVADHMMNAMKAIHDYMSKDGINGW